MNLEMLQYFQHTARYKNITKAAKHFYISQSTLSRQIIALENELGVKLFERSNKHVELTEAGEVFYQDCESFINHMATITQNVQAADQGNSGILRITSPSTLSPILSDALTALREKHPSVRLVIESYDFNEIPSAIRYDLYNIGITYDFSFFNHEELQSIPIGTDNFSLVVSSKLFTELTEETITEVVQSLPLILPSHVEPPFLKLLLYQLQDIARVRNINTLYVNTTESVMLEVSLGLGYGIVPTSWLISKNYNKDITSAPLESFTTTCTILMLYKKTNTSLLVNNFIDIVKDLRKNIN